MSNLRSLVRRIVCAYKYHQLRRRATFHGQHHVVGVAAGISLRDGSTSKDVVLDDYVALHGHIASQSRGQVHVEAYTQVGRDVSIEAVERVSIGRYCVLARNCVVTDNNTHCLSPFFRHLWAETYDVPGCPFHLYKYSTHKPVRIEDNVWIGEHARICKGVTIGQGSIVGASAVVTKDVPPYCVVAGNPARVVREGLDKYPLPQDQNALIQFLEAHGKHF